MAAAVHETNKAHYITSRAKLELVEATSGHLSTLLPALAAAAHDLARGRLTVVSVSLYVQPCSQPLLSSAKEAASSMIMALCKMVRAPCGQMQAASLPKFMDI